MNAAAVAADRNRRVRLAARAWRAAGVVGDETVAEIDRRFPDDRVRVGLALRLLLFALTWVAVFALIGLMALASRSGGVLFVAGVVCWSVAELLTSGFRVAGSGADEASALAAVVSLAAWVGWSAIENLHLESSAVEIAVGLALVGLSLVAGWRFGEPLFGAVGVAGLALALTQTPDPRIAWLAAPCLLVPLLERIRRSHGAAPAHRDAAEVAILALAAIAYFAANLWSLDANSLESWRAGTAVGSRIQWEIAWALTVLLPPAALAVGAFRRDRLWLWLGALMAAASGITLRHYVHLAPLWALLVAVGAVVGAIALLLKRWFDAGQSGERRGVTARPLFERALVQPAEIVAALATLAPAARTLPPESAFKPGGGGFGGGGASESF